MLMRVLFSALIFFFICLPAILLSIAAVPVMLLCGWDGRSTIFGNKKWGKGNEHPSHGTKGFWQEFNWLVFRNPVNNLHSFALAVPMKPYYLKGDGTIGDKTHGGFYRVRMGWHLDDIKTWEYYWIYPYSKKLCIRARIGWKINGNSREALAPFVFTFNPVKPYRGM